MNKIKKIINSRTIQILIITVFLVTVILVSIAVQTKRALPKENIKTDTQDTMNEGVSGTKPESMIPKEEWEQSMEEAVQNANFAAGAAKLMQKTDALNAEDFWGANEPVMSLDEKLWLTIQDKYGNIAAAKVNGYVNIRKDADMESSIVGKAYDGAVVLIIEQDGEWYHIQSGSVDGYVKAEFFITGAELAGKINQYLYQYAVVNADKLNVRQEPSADSKKVSSVIQGKRYDVISREDGFALIEYATEQSGWISEEYLTLSEEFVTAISIEEEQAKLEAQKEAQRQAQEIAAAQNAVSGETGNTTNMTQPSSTYANTTELRQAIVDYAMQFLGNKYVSGGSTLAGGTDCSGFTCLIYKEFGYSIDRTPAGQYQNAGKSISYSEAQPGDILCYGTSRISHVGLYIGDGMIIHEANSRKGVVIYYADYDTIVGVKDVID